MAWVPERRSGPEWDARLAAKDIAIGRDDTCITWLMSIEAGGYIDVTSCSRTDNAAATNIELPYPA